MLITFAAVALTAVVAYGVVAGALDLAGDSPAGRVLVYVLAFATGFILPYAVVDGIVGLFVTDEA